MKAYLDIDGVILTKDGKQMPCLKSFLEKLFDVYGDEVYWLTTHCKNGENIHVFNHLMNKLDEDILEILKRVKPTSWYELKTEAIDFKDECLWLDDNVFLAEQEELRRRKKEYFWVKVEENLEEIANNFL